MCSSDLSTCFLCCALRLLLVELLLDIAIDSVLACFGCSSWTGLELASVHGQLMMIMPSLMLLTYILPRGICLLPLMVIGLCASYFDES